MKKKLKIFKKNVERKIKANQHYEINKDGQRVTRKISKRKVLKMILLAFIIMCILGLLAIGSFFAYIVIKAPTFNPDDLYSAESSVLYDKDGNQIARLGSEVRDLVNYDQLPEVLVDSIVATEDSRFFQHNGFDLPRFLMASLKQLLGNNNAGGASTLTMQISKNKLTSTNDSGFAGIVRKFTDIYLSVFKIEKTYTKQEIMEFYVNSNYLGDGVNGVQDAAEAYFGKSVSDLNLSEAAMIAGLFNAPNYYDPYQNPDGCEQRRETVLYLLKRHGYISEDEYNIAMKMTVSKIIKPQTTSSDEQAFQSFVNTAVQEVIDKTGDNPYEVSMQIYTTMDRDQQSHIESILAGTYSGYKWQNDVVQAGIAVVSATDGSITAVGAGRNRVARDYNYATDLKNQIGSTAKPLYEYALGIDKLNWSTGQVFVDEPWGYTGGDQIKNWDLKYEGFVSMRTALVESRNIPALKAFQSIDNSLRVPWVQSLGLHPEIENGVIHEAHATGGYNGESPLSMAAAYNAFANGGYYIAPYSVTKIVYSDGRDNYEYKYTATRVMGEDTAWMITNLLESVAKGTGFNAYNVNGVTYAAKSGTTNLDSDTIAKYNLPSSAVADIWAIGYTNKYTIATWYGYDHLSSTYYNTFGSGQNYRLFAAVAKGVFKEQSTFTQPDNVVAVQIETGCYTLCLPSEYTPSNMITTEYFKKGYEPTTVSDRYSKLSDVTNLKASTSGSTVKLTWDAIATPHAIDLDYLKTYFGAAYKDADWGVNAAQTRYNDDLSQLGTIVYKVYEQTSSGLNLVATTADNNASVTPTSSNPTYVVKTSYTVFTANASDGASIKVSGATVSDLVTATQDITTDTVKVGDTKLADESKIATVNVNGTAVSASKVSYDYTLDKSKVSGDTYSLSVKVIYNSETVDTFTIKITVQ